MLDAIYIVIRTLDDVDKEGHSFSSACLTLNDYRRRRILKKPRDYLALNIRRVEEAPEAHGIGNRFPAKGKI